MLPETWFPNDWEKEGACVYGMCVCMCPHCSECWENAEHWHSIRTRGEDRFENSRSILKLFWKAGYKSIRIQYLKLPLAQHSYRLYKRSYYPLSTHTWSCKSFMRCPKLLHTSITLFSSQKGGKKADQSVTQGHVGRPLPGSSLSRAMNPEILVTALN